MSKNEKEVKSGSLIHLLGLIGAKKNEGIVLLSVAATILLIVRVVLKQPIGIPGEWDWPTRTIFGARFWPPLLGAVLLLATAGWLTRPNRWERIFPRLRALWLIWLVLIAWLLAMGIRAVPEYPVLRTAVEIASPQVTSYFSTAVGITDLPAALRQYPSLMEKMPQHARTHPPGPVAYFWGVIRLMRAWPTLEKAVQWLCLRLDREGTPHLSEVIAQQLNFTLSQTDALAAAFSAFLLAGIGSLSLIPLYLFTSSLYRPTTALRTAMLFATVPSFLLFAPSIDQFALFSAALMLWGFLLFLRRGNPLIGLFFAFGLLITLGLVAMALLLALWWLAAAGRFPAKVQGLQTTPGGDAAKQPAEQTLASPRILLVGLIAATLIFLGIFVVLWLAAGLNFPAIVKTGLLLHRHTTLEEASRTYWKWVFYNPVEFACFLGMPVVIWAAAGLGDIRSRGLRGGFAFGWLMTLVLLNLSGWVRAETGRLWLFLMPPAALIAAHCLGQSGKRFDLAFFSALVLQIGQALTMRAGLDLFIIK